MEGCEVMLPIVYVLTHITVFVAGFVVAMWAITRKPDLELPVDDLCWPDGDHTPPEYYRKDKKP